MKRAFTLIEVNLAMLIMAGGILSIVGLYSFGFRENRQGKEDVAAAAFADAVVSPLVMALSSTNLAWSTFRQEFKQPGKLGWGEYIDQQKGVVNQNPSTKAKSTFTATISWAQSCGARNLTDSFPTVRTSPELYAGLVVLHEQDSTVVSIGFRATDKVGTLMSMPLFLTEVRFQGDPNR